MALIETENCTLRYSAGTPFEREALHDVSVSIEEGEFVGVIGHTGSGKSSFVQLLNGLLKPESGRVLLDGRDIWESPKEIRKVRFEVGMVFQYPEYQLFEETVFKDIAFGPHNMGLSDEEIRERVVTAAEWVGLKAELLEKSPFELSGGEKRRAAIAGVMAMRPRVLILDEPTAGLDPRGRDLILNRIRAYQQEFHTTVLLVSHSMEDIARVADRVLVLNNGSVAMFETTDRIFSQAAELENMGLSVPAVTKIFAKLRERGFAVPDSVYTVETAKAALLTLLKGGADNAV
ncbi:MAG: energy-coupling factor transporter ATPase [Clostridia bacterium]|nr:energy-coupling factor transporter ATPase [Clostridia bacterium]MBQ7038613.1 energy-coupling factor transporter ATPase [Clostridia bacterium]